jgi:hypothetical protein
MMTFSVSIFRSLLHGWWRMCTVVVALMMMMIRSDHYGTATFVQPPPPPPPPRLLLGSSRSMGTLVIPTLRSSLSTFLVRTDTATIRRRNDWAFAAAVATEHDDDDDDDDDEMETTSRTTTLRNDDDDASSLSLSSSVSNTKDDALAAVAAVGWSIPGSRGDRGKNILEEEEEDSSTLTSNDPFVQAIDASIQFEMGVSLEDLLNPAKVVNLERDLYRYRRQLAQLTGATITTTTMTTTATTTATTTLTTTADCDNGGGGAEADMLRQLIQTKEATLLTERRSVFRGWFKTLFLYQAMLSFGLSYVMATTPATLFGHYDWYNNPQYNMDLSISVLGYWWWWLFVIPSLRSRRPKGYEKQALDVAFLASPVVSLMAPVVTKDTGIIWWANAVVVGGAYGYAFWSSRQPNQNDEDDDDEDDSDSTSQQSPPKWWKFVYQSLDFGSGRERGAR